ncbi:MAG TPA: glycosyltransferase family 9 protein [Bryobacteraceae bacterium]|nr:glycosyltransferase family 9 protein [Bryobacteraceae bacterium]
MAAVLERLPEGARIAVVRLRSLGDCVLTTPALALLKRHRPDLRLAIVVESRFRAVFEGNPDLERILDPRPRALFRWRPRLALNLHGGARSMVLTAASAAPLRAGFAHHRYRFLYSHRIPRAQDILGQPRPVHTAEHLASAMFWLGVPLGEIPRAKLFAQPEPSRPPYAVLHPFASAPAKTWPAVRFLLLAAELKRSLGLDPVFLAGPADDFSPFAAFEVCNAAPLSRVKSLLAGAQLFVGNDSGPAHMAAAFGLPVVALFGDSDPSIWAPWRTPARVLSSPGGIAGISLEEVVAAAHSIGAPA